MNMFEEHTPFKTKDGTDCYFIKVIKDRVLIWKGDVNVSNQFSCGSLDFATVNEDLLSSAGIWDELPKKIQDKINKTQEIIETAVKEKMGKARERRRKKYDFSKYPEFLKCKCGRETKANYYYLQKKADKKKVPLDDIIKGYQCQKCNPTKGCGRKKKT